MGLQSDLIAAVEAAYRLDLDETTWLRTISEAVRSELDEDGFGVVAYAYDARDPARLRMGTPVGVGATPELLETIPRVAYATPPELIERSYQYPRPVVTISQAVELPEPFAVHPLGAEVLALGIRDVLAMRAVTTEGIGCMVTVALPEPRHLAPNLAERWSRIAAHLAAGLRLRRRLAPGAGSVEAVLTPAGHVAHAESAAQPQSARDRLRDSVRAMERARGSLRNDRPDEALEIWRGLVSGRWSLVDRFDSDGRRFIVARRNEPDVRDPRALTARERQVAAYAALGHSTKLIAYTLGMSRSTVSTHLAHARRKLGVRSRLELAHLLAAARLEATDEKD